MKSRIDKYLKSAVFEFSLGLPCGHITEMELQKTYRLHHRHSKRSTQISSINEKEAEVFSSNKSQTILFKVSSNTPVLLQSHVILDEKEKDVGEGKNKQESQINVRNASTCTDEAPHGQASLSEASFWSANIEDKQRFYERDPKLKCHSSPNVE
ncbi:uncharacterized protein LOC130420647 isoform X3 [Triplophysa dalaica]|uniref:uncharacterized protein LOC130420647 isoform X3 n=1 Tax=Triplophysa dalaica TaxID=1582913 RepID=UPI0024E03F0E|nr:uncharacterized protein LOC130420647 isoform X3 [Triplophysa dalaica]